MAAIPTGSFCGKMYFRSKTGVVTRAKTGVFATKLLSAAFLRNAKPLSTPTCPILLQCVSQLQNPRLLPPPSLIYALCASSHSSPSTRFLSPIIFACRRVITPSQRLFSVEHRHLGLFAPLRAIARRQTAWFARFGSRRFRGFFPSSRTRTCPPFPTPLFSLRTNNIMDSICNDIDLIHVQFRCHTLRIGCVVAFQVRCGRESSFASGSSFCCQTLAAG